MGKGKSEIVISPHDKLQALRSSKQYAEDYAQYLRERGNDTDMIIGDNIKLSNAGKLLCAKWNLRYPINPEGPVIEPDTVLPKGFIFEDIEMGHSSPVITFLVSPEDWKESRALS